VPETVVLLHGFSGTRRAWDGVIERLDGERYLPLALDLAGHGADSANSGPIGFPECVEQVLAGAPGRFALCGYSLGGRVALHVALAAPERVTRLVLVSSSPGIEDPQERRLRRAADRQLADELETGSFEEFIERWRTQALFAADPAIVGELARADQRRNRPEALAAVLRGLGTGEMESMWRRLGELAMPVRLVVGDRDEKFVSLARRALPMLVDGSLSVLDGGHVLPLEDPAGVARVLEGVDPQAGA
jgi:2-succinyl-6-hydroxy-2,4-cyclohexadiene-1-carboxylate synthase